jgi:hypothetical protein
VALCIYLNVVTRYEIMWSEVGLVVERGVVGAYLVGFVPSHEDILSRLLTVHSCFVKM